MMSSLLQSKPTKRNSARSPFPSPYRNPSSPDEPRRHVPEITHAAAAYTETEDEEHGEEGDAEDEVEDAEDDVHEEDPDDHEDEDARERTPLLPIFSAAHLDALPVYNLTHTIRLIILPRCETTLTWDQLRSPQVSQFLVKPMLQMIRSSHFSRATLYALMANSLQFEKEAQMNPSNAGTSTTRSKVCELIAIKLLKEYNTRELIDALSYDFFPLQGLMPAESIINPGPNWEQRARPAASRTSTLEVAIRAQAKRFLAHPVVVQQLEAIWAGNIVFHSAADNLHRPQQTPNLIQYKTTNENTPLLRSSPDKLQPSKQRNHGQQVIVTTRRTVTLYDPRDASLFKLSRLRVPRYRQFLSTCSLAVLLGLFLAVLIDRSLEITTLEVVFWFWSAGFMLDELVGFNEQGFSLYIMSFWNTFDLGILILLILYCAMRLYGIVLVDIGKAEWNSMAYDVLASTAVLLFPRLFSVLDHYRYFSQLLIAFRLMTVDLIAVFTLIVIACSGFFVAFTLSFGRGEYDANGVMFKMFQLIMGFTPAAWEAWETYNMLGRAILTLFLFICHFLIVTILITVLTNSFMKIVSNANEEHQFVFAVNTISMVKNDALFSYVAPTNILAWILAPVRYMIPFRSFIKLNRTVIKVTHFPLLFSIFAYEKIFLASSVFEPTDLVEHKNRKRLISFADPRTRPALFSPTIRLRQESVAGFQKDRALDEVFRLAPRNNGRIAKNEQRRNTSFAVNDWMDNQEGIASSPPEQDRDIVDRLEARARQTRRASLLRRERFGRDVSGTRSVYSDPADLMSTGADAFHHHSMNSFDLHLEDTADADADGADGDDELGALEDDENVSLSKRSHRSSRSRHSDKTAEDYFRTPTAARLCAPLLSSSVSSTRHNQNSGSFQIPRSIPSKHHSRQPSSTTILFNPPQPVSSNSISSPKSPPMSAHPASTGPGPHPPTVPRSPKKDIYSASKPRPIMPPRNRFSSGRILLSQQSRSHQIRHRRSSLDMDFFSDIGDGISNTNHLAGAVPSSFATQMAMATGMVKRRGADADDTEMMMGRLMLARMKTLEEGFQEVVREFKEMRSGNATATASGNVTATGNSPIEGGRRRIKKRREKARQNLHSTSDTTDDLRGKSL